LVPTGLDFAARNSFAVALRTADWTYALELLKASEPPAEFPNLGFLARQLT